MRTMCSLFVEDIIELGKTLFVTLYYTENNKNRVFAVISEGESDITGIKLHKKYLALRSPHTTHNKLLFFIKTIKTV